MRAPSLPSLVAPAELRALVDSTNIVGTFALPSASEFKANLPLTQAAASTVYDARTAIQNILGRTDNRLIVIAGPCSIHDPAAALEYARNLHTLSQAVSDVMLVVMRVYFEKPRSAFGWKGFISDPKMDGSFNMPDGLRLARELLLEINAMGLPTATEALDPVVPGYLGDLISWTAIGARTTESQTHREMSSGISSPVGFKNGMNGDLNVALGAIRSASRPHSFLGIADNGSVAQIRTKGNRYCHIVLRGGSNGTNYDYESIAACTAAMERAATPANIMVDCSHGNSGKIAANQAAAFTACIDSRLGENGRSALPSLIGLMLESHLHHGAQKIPDDLAASPICLSSLQHGVSITDECIGFSETENLLLTQAGRLRLAGIRQ